MTIKGPALDVDSGFLLKEKKNIDKMKPAFESHVYIQHVRLCQII